MTPALQRAIRTFIQAAVGSFIASGALSAANTDGVVDWDILQKAGISAFIAGVIALASWVQNGLEDTKKIPVLLKPVAAVKKAAPRARARAKADAGQATWVACVAVLALVLVTLVILGVIVPH